MHRHRCCAKPGWIAVAPTTDVVEVVGRPDQCRKKYSYVNAKMTRHADRLSGTVVRKKRKILPPMPR